jgi:uncharacterized protein (UPF0218 family)
MLTLPEEHRKLFKEPFGELHETLEEILPRLSGHIIYAVGDVVTSNLRKNGVKAAIEIVDGHTMRSPCNLVAHDGKQIYVKNPAGSLSDELIRILDYAVAHPPVTIIVDGEEDLAVIPLVLSAPEGAIILYGQPNEGVVLRTIDHDAKETAHRFLSYFIRIQK